MKRTPPPHELEKHERDEIRQWCRSRFPKLERKLFDMWEDCRDYYLLQGERGWQFSWSACFRRWVRRQAAFDSGEYKPAARGTSERPQEQRKWEPRDLIRIRNALKEDKDGTNEA